jgi:predicted nucleotidyltransferase
MSENTSAAAESRALLPAEPFLRYREDSARKRAKLDELLSKEIPAYASDDTSFVVFGSLARNKWTSGSDLDWTYLIDGQANSDHLRISQKIQTTLEKAGFVAPGSTGTFGNMAFSHDIIHQIGGQGDTNRNTTQRILLLLESAPIGARSDAHERVVRAVISRYLEEDTHPLTQDDKEYRVPRFLLNDIVRFWRTMAVDFASKQRDRAGKGWGIRNAKLRMSRKLIFASGLLLCFSANLDPALQAEISTGKNDIQLKLASHIRNQLKATPLEFLARSIEHYGVSEATGKQLFVAYGEFLDLLNDEASRNALKNLRSEDSRTDEVFQKVRRFGTAFEQAIDHIFFENKHIAPLTRKYGVF